MKILRIIRLVMAIAIIGSFAYLKSAKKSTSSEPQVIEAGVTP